MTENMELTTRETLIQKLESEYVFEDYPDVMYGKERFISAFVRGELKLTRSQTRKLLKQPNALEFIWKASNFRDHLEDRFGENPKALADLFYDLRHALNEIEDEEEEELV